MRFATRSRDSLGRTAIVRGLGEVDGVQYNALALLDLFGCDSQRKRALALVIAPLRSAP